MKTSNRPLLRSLLGAACCIALAGTAHAENYALIMTIDYSGSHAQLPPTGIEADGHMAREIALGMGVPQANIRWLRNGMLGLPSMSAAIDDLTRNRIREGDKVFVYYSGHGTQLENTGSGSKCTEAMVSADLKPYTDDRLEAALGALAAKASQVVMLNDSCFSGGQATKSLDRGLGDGAVAKVYFDPASKEGGSGCNQPVNKNGLSRTLGIVNRFPSTRILYVAAAAENEVSWALPNGSTATVAWSQCLSRRDADTDGNGVIDGNELQRCAQGLIDRAGGRRQTITVVGTGALPLNFTSPSGGGQAHVRQPNQTLETMHQAADPTIAVDISVHNPRLRIGRDLLDFSVRVDRPGYLYLLHVDTDGKFYQLFPNRLDSNNYVNAGSHQFPRPAWGIQAQGPEGRGYIMAYMSDTQRNFSKEMDVSGTFASAEATESNAKTLVAVALKGRYGASRVVAVDEVK
ncbi:MAG: DUF4384 domain-containing protein [Pseudomonadota bacterium]